MFSSTRTHSLFLINLHETAPFQCPNLREITSSWGISLLFWFTFYHHFTSWFDQLRQVPWQPFPSLNYCWFLLQIRPYAEVTASIEGHLAALIIRAGVYGDGTLLSAGLPATLFLRKHPSAISCATVSADLTALKLSAGLYFELCLSFRSCGERKNLLRFGTWAAIRRNWTLMEPRCSWCTCMRVNYGSSVGLEFSYNQRDAHLCLKQ